MTRPVVILGSTLLLASAAVFLWKVVGHSMPILPSEADNVWRVELQIDLLALAQRGSVSIQLPKSGARQEIYDERFESEGLSFEVRSAGPQPVGIWSGFVSGTRRLSHTFRVRLSRAAHKGDPVPETLLDGYLGPAAGLPVGAPEIDVVLARLRVDDDAHSMARMRRLFAFVSDEIDSVSFGSRDALITLVSREGSSAGQARLLTTLLRRSGVPARAAIGLRLAAPREEREIAYVEAAVDGRWVPLLPSLGTMGTLPADLVVIGIGETNLVEASGVSSIHHRFKLVREALRPEELKVVMLPASQLLAWLSLYQLPVGTQLVLRILLVLPLAALIVACFRNLVGLSTFGTFLPVLIPLSLRDSGLTLGLVMLATVLGVGVFARMFLDRFRLLFVPRICVLLSLVVLLLVGFALVGHSLTNRDLLSGVLLPIVILTMLIERVSITVAEEGVREALLKFGNTMIVVLLIYPLFRSKDVAQLFFGFPELVLGAMGFMVLIGGYRGYRLTEILRFRALAALSDGSRT
jgi:transglutaminase-like putative cysteine protease